jgi:hypothetical protein
MSEWNWNDADEGTQETNYKNVTEGTYNATVEKAEIKTTSKGDDYLKIWWRINGGEFDNKMVFMPCYCHTEATVNMFKGTMSKLGLKDKMANAKDTATVLTTAMGLINETNLMAEIFVKQNGDFMNTYINDLISEQNAAPVNHAPKGIDMADKLPF